MTSGELGEAFYSITFKVDNLDKAVEHLTRRGVALEHRSQTMAVTDPASSHGIRFGFSQLLLPNDPR